MGAVAGRERRHRARLAGAAALTAALALTAASDANAADRWRVSGTFSGTYDNTVGWEQCSTGATGTSSEHAELDVQVGPGTARFDRVEPSFGVTLKVAGGGRWTLSGTYAPRSFDANGNASCGSPAPFGCNGAMTSVTGKRKAAMLFVRRGRTFFGAFSDFIGVREDPGTPESCPALAGDEAFAVIPLLGLTTGNAIEAVVEGTFAVPASRLAGHRAFTVAVTPSSQVPPQCPDAYPTCSQDPRLVFTLRFTPRR
jgi:hypothetical protein